jgi:protein involved in polysaccharide export with SLBB domain
MPLIYKPAFVLHWRTPQFLLTLALAILLVLSAAAAMAQTANRDNELNDPATSGPVRLRQAAPPANQRDSNEARENRDNRDGSDDRYRPAPAPAQPYVPGEFERFVQRQVDGLRIRRFGSELVTAGAESGNNTDISPLVPQDYVLAVGDEVLVILWGSVDADLRLTVDRSGRISIPRVGAVQVAGIRYAELQSTVERRVAQVFRNFQLSVSLGQLRGVRVFVTGFVAKPGTYNVSSLSTVVGALMRAGGPSSAGSFRDVQLRRGTQLVGSFDLYDLLVKGDRSADRVVQAGDVIHVGAVGPQVGVIGSVNRPAVIELKPGETVTEALRVAGGFSAVADRTRLGVERLRDRGAARIEQLELPRDLSASLTDGDVVRAFSAVDVVLPTQRQSKRVRVEGEVARPAEYVLPEGSTVADALRAAGGLTGSAYIFASEFNRESVRLTQQENYDRALRDLESDLARTATSQRVSSSEEAAGQAARSAATTRLIERLRALRPSGRVVLQMTPESNALPDLALEDGDRLLVPARPTTIGVFGSVFNAASYLYLPDKKIADYLRLAGGPTKGADEGSVFVVRANGDVVSTRQQASSWLRRGSVDTLPAEPGDTVFVPEEMDKTTFVQAAKDWTQILYQFGVGIAGLKSATR